MYYYFPVVLVHLQNMPMKFIEIILVCNYAFSLSLCVHFRVSVYVHAIES